ncbi:MAG: hypothetical protein M1530_03935 [Candidatus Marsarchaeota archaeon]|nr:hypothetical protein [Candidatus Marsarchaeota archaeon]
MKPLTKDPRRFIDAGKAGKYKIAEFTGKGGLSFPDARAKYGDRIASSKQTEAILLIKDVWETRYDLIFEARPFHTRTFVALSDAPLGDLEKDDGKIYVTRTLDTETLRFGGFSEAGLKKNGIKLDSQGTLFVIDQKYGVKREGKNEYSIEISPELFQFIDVYYDINFKNGWRETEPKHGLPIGKEGDYNDLNVLYLYAISTIGPVRRGLGYYHGDRGGVDIGNWLDDRRGLFERLDLPVGL